MSGEATDLRRERGNEVDVAPERSEMEWSDLPKEQKEGEGE